MTLRFAYFFGESWDDYESPTLYKIDIDLTSQELTPVYRFYNTKTGNHFYTISEEEKDYVIADYPEYVYEGIAYYAYLG